MPKPADIVSEEWEEIAPFTEPRNLDEGESIIGFYRGAQTVNVPDPNSDSGEKRESLLHEFSDTPEGEPYGIWGSAVLDKRLAEIPSGSRVKVQYDGKQDLEGGRTARRYRVWVDRSQPF